MNRDPDSRKRISADVAKRLTQDGAPLPSFGQLSEGTAVSRQLLNYYFEDPTDLLLEVCDHLAEAYRMALVVGAQGLEGQALLHLILDFYFDLVGTDPKPRDDQAYDAMMAYAAGSPKIRTALREQYTLLGQILALEIKIVHPHLPLEQCGEISYLFTCLMYGHWKMVASLGLSDDHKLIARQAVDRIISLYAQESTRPKGWPRAWQQNG
jgi:AcrR family transcriptional regulator